MKAAFRALAVAALAFGLTGGALAAGFTVPPVPHRYVTDEADALDASTASALEDELRSFENRTKHQVIVYIAKTTGDVPLETWTAETAHTWKIGRKGKDDGAILFLFMQDRKVRIEVGYGLEDSLTDADANRIIQDDVVPRMRSGQVGDAVSAGVAGMLAAIDPSAATPPPQAPNSEGDINPVTGWIIFIGFWLLIIGYFVFFITSMVRRGITIARGGGRLFSSGGSWSSSGDSSSSDFSSSSGGFDAGGGDFGGGGASGSW